MRIEKCTMRSELAARPRGTPCSPRSIFQALDAPAEFEFFELFLAQRYLPAAGLDREETMRIDPNRPTQWPTIRASPIVPRSVRRRSPRLKPAHHLLMRHC